MKVLFVNSKAEECGVHQFGLSLFRVLSKSVRHEFRYVTPQSAEELSSEIGTETKVVLWNFYPCTMGWVTLELLRDIHKGGVRNATVFHEVPVNGFEFYFYPDPTFIHYEIPGSLRTHPFTRTQIRGDSDIEAHGEATSNVGLGVNDTHWFSIGRPIDSYSGGYPVNAVPTIGSSGFGFGWKGHTRVVELAAAEFDRAHVRLNIPFAFWGDRGGSEARARGRECASIAANTGGRITLEVNHDFMQREQYLAWLAANDLNCYLYAGSAGRGIASTTDHALAVRRPIAVTKVEMMRHLHACQPSICIEDNRLPEILANGVAPLLPIYEQFSDAAMNSRVDHILDRILVTPTRSNSIYTPVSP